MAIKDNRPAQTDEAALVKTRNLLAEIEKLAKTGGWEFNIDTREQVWTEETYRIHEVDQDFRPDVEKGINFYTPASRPIIARAVQRAIEYGEAFDLELEIITARGNIRMVHAIGQADLEARRIYGLFQDITDIRQAQNALRLERATLNSIIDLNPYGIQIYDADGHHVRANQAFFNMFHSAPPPDYCFFDDPIAAKAGFTVVPIFG